MSKSADIQISRIIGNGILLLSKSSINKKSYSLTYILDKTLLPDIYFCAAKENSLKQCQTSINQHMSLSYPKKDT